MEGDQKQREKRFDVVGIGECLIELYEDAPNLYRQSVAGDVFNTLFYASGLGLKTGFISHFGSDDLTNNILSRMHAAKIDRSCTSRSDTNTNGMYLISTEVPESPRYSFWRNDSAARYTLRVLDHEKLGAYISSSRYFHFSAIALAILHERDILISILRELHGEVMISFDTNFRKGLWNSTTELRTFLESASSFIDLLFVSKTDDEHIFGDRSSKAALEYYVSLGFKLIILKQGQDDVLIRQGREEHRMPTVHGIQVVDATAAGDAFNAGFITAHGRGESLESCARFGNNVAAIVLGKKGALIDNIQSALEKNIEDGVPHVRL